MSFKSPIDISGQDVLQVFTLRKQLTAGQGWDGVRVREVQLKVNDVALLEGLLGVFRNEVPNACVGNVDCTIEIRGRVPFDRPQEGVQVSLLGIRWKYIYTLILFWSYDDLLIEFLITWLLLMGSQKSENKTSCHKFTCIRVLQFCIFISIVLGPGTSCLNWWKLKTFESLEPVSVCHISSDTVNMCGSETCGRHMGKQGKKRRKKCHIHRKGGLNYHLCYVCSWNLGRNNQLEVSLWHLV